MDQFRHCKAMLVAREADALLSASGVDVPAKPDAGFIQAKAADFGAEATVSTFIAAVARHKHYARETDPPRV
jgi:catalase